MNVHRYRLSFNTPAFLGNASEQTQREIDQEVRRILDEANEKVRHILEVRRASLEALGHDEVWTNRDQFHKALKTAAAAQGLKFPAPLLKAVTAALGVQDDAADVCTDASGNPEPDTSLRDTENVPWDQDVDDYLKREVLPYAPDAWIDHAKTKEGAEIPFTRYFYKYVPPRSLEEIDRDLEAVMNDLRRMLTEVER